jgi:hypothetical protein
VAGPQGGLRATCPYRFHEDLDVFHWVGETILSDHNPQLVGEVGFLEASATTDGDAGDDVGRIDMVLVSTKPVEGAPMDWCALEIQAVYFSGDAMRGEFKAYMDPAVDWVVFPAGPAAPGLPKQRAQASDAAASNKGADAAKVGTQDGCRRGSGFLRFHRRNG